MNNKIYLRVLGVILALSAVISCFYLIYKISNKGAYLVDNKQQIAQENGNIISDAKTGLNIDESKTTPNITVTQPEKKEVVTKPAIKKVDDLSYAYDAASVKRWMANSKESDYPDKKIVFLTFDDGPSANVTPIVLDTLKKNNAHATFFTIGGNAEGKKNNLLRIMNEGHALGVHSYSHDYSYLYPHRVANKDHIIADFTKQLNEFKAVLGEDFAPTVFRYPGGHMSWKKMEEADAAMKSQLGLEWMDWNSMTGDADSHNPDKSPSGLANFMIRKNKQYGVGNVVVVLMHDSETKMNTAKALQKVIDYYKENGYEFGILK